MYLCSTFTCCLSPLQAGSSWEDRGSRIKCAGEGTGGVGVHKEMFPLLQFLWVPLAAETSWYSMKHLVLRAKVGACAEGESFQPGYVACGQADQAFGCLWLGVA